MFDAVSVFCLFDAVWVFVHVPPFKISFPCRRRPGTIDCNRWKAKRTLFALVNNGDMEVYWVLHVDTKKLHFTVWARWQVKADSGQPAWKAKIRPRHWID